MSAAKVTAAHLELAYPCRNVHDIAQAIADAEDCGRVAGIREAAKAIKVPSIGAASCSFDSFCEGMRKAKDYVKALLPPASSSEGER